MKITLALPVIAISLIGHRGTSRPGSGSIEQMPAELETRFALSALACSAAGPGNRLSARS